MVSIIILTHNAPDYVKLVLDTMTMTRSEKKYEIIVLDNASEKETLDILCDSYKKGLIDKLILGKENLFFAKGNNKAVKFASDESRYFLFLNSDIEIKRADWLDKLFSIHTKGITSFGLGMSPKGKILPDGYCFLIDRKLYEKYPMNEEYEWWYGISYTIAPVLRSGYDVHVVNNYEKYIHHFGGKSGDAWKSAKGMDVSTDFFDTIYKNCKNEVEVIYDLDSEIGNKYPNINILRGICDDGWCLQNVDFEIMVGEKGLVNIHGLCPFEKNKIKKIFVEINKKKTVVDLIDEDFNVSVKKGIKNNMINRVSIWCNFAYEAPAPDIRKICFLLQKLEAE